MLRKVMHKNETKFSTVLGRAKIKVALLVQKWTLGALGPFGGFF